ncbi:hypothetical protein LguiA_027558 [Lonicera macranthoides]
MELLSGEYHLYTCTFGNRTCHVDVVVSRVSLPFVIAMNMEDRTYEKTLKLLSIFIPIHFGFWAKFI